MVEKLTKITKKNVENWQCSYKIEKFEMKSKFSFKVYFQETSSSSFF